MRTRFVAILALMLFSTMSMFGQTTKSTEVQDYGIFETQEIYEKYYHEKVLFVVDHPTATTEDKIAFLEQFLLNNNLKREEDEIEE